MELFKTSLEDEYVQVIVNTVDALSLAALILGFQSGFSNSSSLLCLQISTIIVFLTCFASNIARFIKGVAVFVENKTGKS